MKYTRKCKLATQRNQDPAEIALFEPGVDRRATLLVDRSGNNNLVPGTGISLDEFQRYQLRGRQLQARAMASALSGLAGAIVRPLKTLVAAYGRSQRLARATRQLAALDDHLLQDIGIRRESIPAAAAGLMSRPAHAEPAAVRLAPQPERRQPPCNSPHAKAAA